MTRKSENPERQTPEKGTKASLSERILRLDKHVNDLIEDIRPELDKLGEDIFGEDVYGETQGSEEWKKLSQADRNKLRAAFAFGLLSNNIIEDFRNNPYLIAIAIGPGPLGTVIAAGLLTSYAFRTDERGYALRAEMRQMLDMGVQLEDYRDVLRPRRFRNDLLEVDDMALLRMNVNLLAKGSTEATVEFLEKSERAYEEYKKKTGEKISSAAHYTLDGVAGPEKTDCALNTMGKGYHSAEKGAAATYGYTTRALGWTNRNILSPVFREAVETTKTGYGLSKILAGKTIDGYEYNKKEIRALLDSLKPPKK